MGRAVPEARFIYLAASNFRFQFQRRLAALTVRKNTEAIGGSG